MSDRTWSVLFACSVAVLMLAVLLFRSDPAPGWVLVVYPLVGGLVGFAASRTSPSADQTAWIETGTISAAVVILLGGGLNMLHVEVFVHEAHAGEMPGTVPGRHLASLGALPMALLLWWGLRRRLSRLRLSGTDGYAFEARIPAE